MCERPFVRASGDERRGMRGATPGREIYLLYRAAVNRAADESRAVAACKAIRACMSRADGFTAAPPCRRLAYRAIIRSEHHHHLSRYLVNIPRTNCVHARFISACGIPPVARGNDFFSLGGQTRRRAGG